MTTTRNVLISEILPKIETAIDAILATRQRREVEMIQGVMDAQDVRREKLRRLTFGLIDKPDCTTEEAIALLSEPDGVYPGWITRNSWHACEAMHELKILKQLCVIAELEPHIQLDAKAAALISTWCKV